MVKLVDKSLKVLLIDDDLLMHNVVKFQLGRIAEVICTDDPLEGLRLAKTENLDVVLMDIEMPEVSGLELCRTLTREPTGDMIELFLTANADPRNAVLRR
jgi:CheY-like chemotaxis protein